MNETNSLAGPIPSRDVVSRLQEQLGPRTVLARDDVPQRNERDWSMSDPVRPLAVVMPTSPLGVATALRIAAEYGVAVVPQGGLTGLVGGAMPIPGAIALSLEHLVGIEEIDTAASTVTVLAGTTLEAVQRAVEAVGFCCPLDLGSRGSCSIGGNISTNAGGNRVIRYGMARDLVLGIEVALPNGTLLTSLNKMLKNNTGYDLKQLFIGSEGTLGVITRAVLRLFPLPACHMAALCGLASYKSVLNLLANARGSLGPLLSAFEVMWPDYWTLATEHLSSVRRPISGAHAFYVLLEAQGSSETDNRRFQDWLEGMAEAGQIEDAAVAQSLANIKAFWAMRDATAEFNNVIGPHVPFDIGLPIADIGAFADECRNVLSSEISGCRAVFYGHIADGNLHIVAWVPGADAQPVHAIEEVVYRLVGQHKGSVSAEHGIGLKKKSYLHYSRTAEELSLMKTIKHAIDPGGILNPGKVFDT